MGNKKAFTLLEIIVSISLFMIIVLFLYQTLDITQKSNNFYSHKLDIKQKQNSIKKILFLDLAQKKEIIKKIQISIDNDENNRVTFVTTNTYHNPFYQNITYMISKENNLIRIESKDKFNHKKLPDNFFDTAYIDIIDTKILKFKVKIQKNNSLAIYLKKENKENILLNFEQKKEDSGTN